jgi:hypothetical protein
MNLETRIKEHYVREFPADAARLVEARDDFGDILSGLSDAGVSELLERVDPGRLIAVFLSLDDERQGNVLQAASIRTAMLILRGLSEEDRNPGPAAGPHQVRVCGAAGVPRAHGRTVHGPSGHPISWRANRGGSAGGIA